MPTSSEPNRKERNAMRDRGTGSLYKRPGSKFYQIKFSTDGRVYRESTGTDKITAAKAILQQKLNQLEQGTYSAEAKKVRVSDLVDAVLTDYEVNGKRSLGHVQMRWKQHLEPVFDHLLAAHVTSDDIERYKQGRLTHGASNATVNRELALLKRAFHLGMRATPRRYSASLTSQCWRKTTSAPDSLKSVSTTSWPPPQPNEVYGFARCSSAGSPTDGVGENCSTYASGRLICRTVPSCLILAAPRIARVVSYT